MNELALLLRVFFGAVLRAFFPAMFAEARNAARDFAEDALPNPELKNRLSRRIRARWGRQALAGGTLMMVCVCLAGCGTRTVYVAGGEPVRLRETVKEVSVWVMGEDGRPVTSRMDLPAGWYCLPDPGIEESPATPEPDSALAKVIPYDMAIALE